MQNLKLFLIAFLSFFLHQHYFLIYALQLSEDFEILVYSGVKQTGKRELISVDHCHNLEDRRLQNAQRFKVPVIKSVDIRHLSCIQVWQYECCTGDSHQISRDETPALSNLYSQNFTDQKDSNSTPFQARSISPCRSSLRESTAPSTIDDLFVHSEDKLESQCGASGLVNVKSFETENAAVYFSFPADEERVNWIYEVMDLGWAYVKKVYGGSYGKLHGIFNLAETGSELKETFGPATALHSQSSCRNLLRLDLSDQNQTTVDADNLIRMMSEIVEGSYGGVLGSPSYWITGNGHGNFSYFSDIFTYDLYTKFRMDKDARRIKEEAAKRNNNENSGSVLLPGKNWFSDWYKPIYEESGDSKFLKSFLQLQREHFNMNQGDSPVLAKVRVFSETMNLGEFILFCSGAAKKDLKDRATAVFGDGGAWQKELDDAIQKYPEVKKEY